MEWHRILPNRQQPKFGASESRHLSPRTRDCSRPSFSSSSGDITFLQEFSVQSPLVRYSGRLDHGKSWQQSNRPCQNSRFNLRRVSASAKQGRCNGADDGGAVREKPQTDMKWEKSKNKKHVTPPSPCALAPSVPPRLFPFPVHGLVVDIVYAIRAASV